MGPGAGRISHIQSQAKARIDARGYKDGKPTFTIKTNQKGTAIALEMIAEYKQRWLAERRALTLTSAEARYLIGRRGERINTLKDRFGDKSSGGGPVVAFSVNIDDKKESAALVMRIVPRKVGRDDVETGSSTEAGKTAKESDKTETNDEGKTEAEAEIEAGGEAEARAEAEAGAEAGAKTKAGADAEAETKEDDGQCSEGETSSKAVKGQVEETAPAKKKPRTRLLDHEQDARNAEAGAKRIEEAHTAVKEVLLVFRSAWVGKRDLRDDEVRALIGKGGSTINKIISETGAEIKVGGKKGEPSSIVIRGELKQQEAAKKIVRELLYEHHRGTATLQVPSNFVGAVIGRGGSNLATVSEETGAKIDLKRGKELSTLYIRGSPESIDKAVAALGKYATYVPADLESAARRVRYQDALLVCNARTPSQRVARLQCSHLVKVHCSFATLTSLLKPNPPRLPPSSPKAADLDDENGIFAAAGKNGAAVYEETMELTGGRRATQVIVGANGSTRVSLEEQFGIVLRVDVKSDVNGTVTVRGAEKDVAACMKSIAELVDAKVRTRKEVAVHPRVIALLSGASFWPQRCLKEAADCDLRFNRIKKVSGQASQRPAKTAGTRRFGRGGSAASRLSSSTSRGRSSSTLEAKARVKVTVTGRSKSVEAVSEMLRAMGDRCKSSNDVERLYVLPKHIRALKRSGARQVGFDSLSCARGGVQR